MLFVYLLVQFLLILGFSFLLYKIGHDRGFDSGYQSGFDYACSVVSDAKFDYFEEDGVPHVVLLDDQNKEVNDHD